MLKEKEPTLNVGVRRPFSIEKGSCVRKTAFACSNPRSLASLATWSIDASTAAAATGSLHSAS